MALAPAARAPVSDAALPAMPVAQALAAARIGAGLGLDGERHVAVAASAERLLSATASLGDMDGWLAAGAAAGLDMRALVPAGLLLPRPESGAVVAELGGQWLARTAGAAFAGEFALVEALAGTEPRVLAQAEIEAALLALHQAPPLDLRQGRFAPPRVAFLALPDWRRMARLAASAALLALLAMVALALRWNIDASAQEQRALAEAQKRFPGVADLDEAERLIAAAASRQGEGARGFAAPMAALLGAMRPTPGVSLRDVGFDGDGTLRFTAAAPSAEALNAVLVALQQQGWKVTVPPSLAPDPTGATVAAMTLRAP